MTKKNNHYVRPKQKQQEKNWVKRKMLARALSFWLYSAFCRFALAEKRMNFFFLIFYLSPVSPRSVERLHLKHHGTSKPYMCPLHLTCTLTTKLNQKLQLKWKPALHYKISSLIWVFLSCWTFSLLVFFPRFFLFIFCCCCCFHRHYNDITILIFQIHQCVQFNLEHVGVIHVSFGIFAFSNLLGSSVCRRFTKC